MKFLRSAPIAVLACLATACSSGSTSTTPDASRGGTDAGHPKADTGGTTKHDAGKDGGKPVTDGSTLGDAATDAVASPTDAPFDASPYIPVDGGDAVITAPPEVWTWVPFPDAKCRNGSPTGIGVNLNPASQNLVIYLEGGGACFNPVTCATNATSFGAADFPGRFPAASDGGAPQPGNGILDRNPANPVKDWSYVYVPYCTGDVHAGNNPNGSVPQVSGTQAFVGYANIDFYLQRLVPTFSTATQVLLTGISAGGFGAAANYLHVQRAFGTIPVELIDDSGPFMENPYLATCLQNVNRDLWNLNSTAGADCAGHCNNPGRFFLDYAQYVVAKYPTRQFGLMDSTDDGTITEYFGFGANDCTVVLPMQVSAATFTAGLMDVRANLASDKNSGSFYFTGTDHTSLGDDNFYTRTAGSTPLTTWVANLLAGTAANVGP